MATDSSARRRRRIGRRSIIIGSLIIVFVLLCSGGAFLAWNTAQTAAQQAAAANWQTETAETGAIEASISATGNVEPKAQASINFETNGTIVEILVKPGDTVTAGQALAKIDDITLQLGLERAQAELKRAEADYQKAVEGATPQEIAEAEAQVASAQGNYQAVAGNVTRADIAAAQARLEQAREELAQLEAGPQSQDLRNAESAAQQAESELASQRDSLSQAKTNAQIELERATNELTKAQTAFATAKGNWDFVNESGRDPSNPDTINPETGREVANKVNNTQRQQYYDAFVQAEATLRSAEAAVQQAQAAYDTARQAEVTGVQSVEQQLAKAQADLDEVRAGPKADRLAAARASVQSAQAELAKLTGANRSGSLAQAQAGIDSARAALERLTSGPRTSDLAIAEASVEVAKVSLKEAERSLEEAILKAPFAGTVADVNLRIGESSGSSGLSSSSSSTSSSSASSGAIVLADLSNFKVEVPVDELDVAQLEPQQPVRITFDALPDQEIEGTITNIAPLATRSQQGTTTYEVTAEITPGDAPIRAGMTASVEIITESKPEAVLVPRRAVQIEDGKNYVYVPTAGPPDTTTGRPASERREVTLGLSNDEFVEITQGLQAGEQVLVQDVVSTFNPVGG
jgi:HlyD family secretion protein